jgi:D-inositol-3-phosphate glycosyltransferase
MADKNNYLNVAIIDPVGSKAGMDLYSYSLLDSLHKKRFSVVLFSNINTESNNISTYNYFKIVNKSLFLKAYALIRGYILSYVTAKRKRIDIIILHVFEYSIMDLFAFLISQMLGFKTLAIVHDVEPFKNIKYISNAIKYIMLNYLSNYIVVHNSYSYECIVKSIRESKKRIVRIIKQGAYTNTEIDIYTKNISIPPEIDCDKKLILFFGQIGIRKGLDILLLSMKFIKKEYKLIIAGRLRDKSDVYYRDIILKNNIMDRIIFLNRYMSTEEKNYLFNVSEIIVLPYKKIYQSAVLLTAMSYKKVVVTSNLPPNLEIIKDGINGFIFESENYIDLANKINCIISLDVKVKKQIENNAYSFVQNEYSWDKIADSYSDLINNTI